MKRVAIIGVGLFSAGGPTLDQTWDFLLAGKSSHLVEGISGNHARRLSKLARVAIDKAIPPLPVGVPIDALCIGSTSASFFEVGHGAELEPGYLGLGLARDYRISSWFQTSQACASSSHAIALGADMIRWGRDVNVVLAGGADEVTPCVTAAFEAVRLHTDQCRPFGAERTGLVLGEAAAFVLLAAEGIGEALCYLDGIGLTCDAGDSVAPTGNGMSRAIVDAGRDAESGQVDFVVAHGTGTKLGDSFEADVISRVLYGWDMQNPPVSSYKGSLGHPQGASGAVGVALAVKALQTQTMFPTLRGKQDPEIPIQVVTTPTMARLKRVLCLSYGSWGTNAALLLKAPEAK